MKLPDVFVVDVFTAEPSVLSSPIDTKSMRLDVEGLASCYDTAAGVGMVGSMADKVKTRKGVPWQLAVVGLVGLLACGFLLPLGAGQWFKSSLPKHYATPARTNTLAVVTNPVPVVITPQPPAPAPASPAPFVPRQVEGGIQIGESANGRLIARTGGEPEKTPRIRMLARRGSDVLLELDSGDRFTVGDGRLQIVGKLAVLDGNRAYRLPGE